VVMMVQIVEDGFGHLSYLHLMTLVNNIFIVIQMI